MTAELAGGIGKTPAGNLQGRGESVMKNNRASKIDNRFCVLLYLLSIYRVSQKKVGLAFDGP